MLDINEILKNFRADADTKESQKFDTTINHTRMEQLIYNEKKQKLDELYNGTDYTISQLEDKATERLPSFKALSQDVFNLLYKINPTDREEESLTTHAQKFNKHIIQKVKENPDYGALKLITEGKDLESIEGTREFVKELYDNLDNLLKEITGEKGTLDRVEKLQEALEGKKEQLKMNIDLYNKLQGENANKAQIESVGAKVESLHRQVEGIKKQIEQFEEIMDVSVIKNKDSIEKRINQALKSSLEKVNEVKDMLEMWGTEDGRPKTIEGKTELISKIKNNRMFQKLAKELGKLRRLAKSTMNKRFTYGRGQRIGIEFGDKLNKVLPSELALLANKETKALFYKKFVDKKLKQYKERTEIFEGRGHIIYMVDESGSTEGDRSIWAKALGVAMMDIAVKDHRNFAFIPFDTRVGNVHHVNYENYSEDIVLKIANTFLGGGTNFTAPIELATKLLMEDRYENADLIFVTDGHAWIDEMVLKKFNEIKGKKRCKCVGILLDKGGQGHVSDTTIKRFCDKIYRTSELSSDKIAEEVMSGVA
jgi:uncharacterized protein with von Willebrand factor type A (vWA) domain